MKRNTIGWQSIKIKTIVRAGISKAVASRNRNREYVSVLETVNAAGKVIPLFIVCSESVHTESYYASGTKFAGYTATFAVLKWVYR